MSRKCNYVLIQTSSRQRLRTNHQINRTHILPKSNFTQSQYLAQHLVSNNILSIESLCASKMPNLLYLHISTIQDIKGRNKIIKLSPLKKTFWPKLTRLIISYDNLTQMIILWPIATKFYLNATFQCCSSSFFKGSNSLIKMARQFGLRSRYIFHR